MFSWAPYAFVRIVIVYIAGILLGIYYTDILEQKYATILFLFFIFLFSVVALLKFFGKLKFFNPGLLGIAATFLAGYIQLLHSTDSRRADHFIHYSDTITFYKAVVTNQAQEKEKSWKVQASVSCIQDNDGQWFKKSGNVLLYLSKKDFQKPFQYGDVLLIKGEPDLLPEPSNPGEFDYKRFLTFRKIYHQQFIVNDEVRLIGFDPPFTIMRYAILAREWSEEKLKKYVHGEREQATASALVLGLSDGLDTELLSAYAATGSLHVLSVSGLHVGIIYWLILLLLKPLNRTTSGKWILTFFSILILWQYAFITGLSPSVLRAVTMFSFVALAQPWGQRTNIYNTLAASAFCLLLFEPYLIMSVGFQLSYIAVIGIVYLQPMLYRVWEPESYLLDKIWQITCVSMAAQIATFSLGLLYFHQFPVYFLFSNLFVIPAAFAVLVLGIAVILISLVSPLASATGFLLEWIIKGLNFGVIGIEAFPFSLINHVYITTFQCWLLIAAIMAVFFLIEFRKFAFVLILGFCLVLFSLVQWKHYYERVNDQKLVVYNVAGHSAFDLIDNGKTFFFSDSALVKDQEKIRFHIRPNRLESGVQEIQNEPLKELVLNFKGCRIVQWRNLTVLHIYEKDFSFPPALSADYFIVSNNSIFDLSVFSSLKFKKLILDSSNSLYFARKIMEEAKEKAVRVHSVLHQGAIIIKQ